MAYVITRLGVGDYESWKAVFDQDQPRARVDSKGHRVFRSVDDPGEVFVVVEFASVEEAEVARERLLSSGVLDRFSDKDMPKIVEETEAVGY